jgi:hypothetical protein
MANIIRPDEEYGLETDHCIRLFFLLYHESCARTAFPDEYAHFFASPGCLNDRV